MPVYLITIHGYRTWGPDKPRGYVRKGEGILPPDDEMARMYDGQAKGDPVDSPGRKAGDRRRARRGATEKPETGVTL